MAESLTARARVVLMDFGIDFNELDGVPSSVIRALASVVEDERPWFAVMRNKRKLERQFREVLLFSIANCVIPSVNGILASILEVEVEIRKGHSKYILDPGMLRGVRETIGLVARKK